MAAADPSDALALAAQGHRVICLGTAGGAELRALCAAGVEVSVSSPEQLGDLPAGAVAHVLVDTGLHRLGFRPAEAAERITEIGVRGVRVAAVWCHVAGADAGRWDEVAREVRTLRNLCPPGAAVHCGGSSLVIERPGLVGDLARVGIALYGAHPDPRQRPLIDLTPALTMWAPIIETRTVSAGDRIGYQGRVLTEPTVVATLPVGVAHGIDPNLHAAAATVHADGIDCPVLVAPMLDYTLIDVTSAPNVRIGTRAELIRADTGSCSSASTLADRLDSTAERLLARLDARIERRVVE